MLGYDEHQHTLADDPTYFLPTIYGSFASGYDFTNGTGFGNRSLVFDGSNFVTLGSARYVHHARNGVFIGNDNELNPLGGLHGYVNDSEVNFLPANVNSIGAFVCRNLPSQPFDWFIYDPATQSSKDLEIPAPGNQFIGPYLYPLALNHSQIPGYDSNGQPLLDSSGQQITVESPLVIGIDQSFGEPMAMLWEENPKTHHYESQYLDRLISPNSGWEIEDAYDVNDSGAVACDGWYQPHNANGNPIGAPQWHGCLLIPVGVFRDDAQRTDDDNLTTPLVDWPASGSNPRSPKYLFAQEDNIFVRVSDTPAMGNSQIKVKVTSESDPAGIIFDLAETSPGTYVNKSPAKPLRLGTVTAANADYVTIKTVNKEVLKFTILKGGVEAVGPDVMVGRAKFASCGIDTFYKDLTGDETVVQTQAITNAKLFPTGNGEFPNNVVEQGNAMGGFVQNAGDGSDGEASWLHVSSHGLPDGTLGDTSQSLTLTYIGSPVVIHNHYPAPVGYIYGDTFEGGKIVRPNDLNLSVSWNKNLDWIVLAACDALNQIGGGSGQWQAALNLNSPHHIHGILGGYEELADNLQSHWDSFWNLLQNDTRVVDAYELAMESGDTQPWAVLYNGLNEDDKLKEITQDGIGYASYAYITTNDLIVGGRSARDKNMPLVETIDQGNGLVRMVLPTLPTSKMRTTATLRQPVDFTRSKYLPFAKGVITFANGSQAFVGRGLTETARNKASLTKDAAATMAADYIATHFPEFSKRLSLKEVDDRISGVGSTSWTSGFLVQFQVTTANVPIWDNYVHVTIAGDQVEGINFHVYDEPQQIQATTTNRDVIQPPDSRSCLAKALPRMKSILGIQSKYEILKAELVYTNRSAINGDQDLIDNNFLLSWHLLVNPTYEGEQARKRIHDVWLDASNGEVIDTKRH
jgi:hypothetical protein